MNAIIFQCNRCGKVFGVLYVEVKESQTCPFCSYSKFNCIMAVDVEALYKVEP